MQIIPFPAHYQSVYTNFDISSFSLISCNGFSTLTPHDKILMANRQLNRERKKKKIKRKNKIFHAKTIENNTSVFVI